MNHDETKSTHSPFTSEQCNWLDLRVNIHAPETPNSKILSCLFIPELPFPWNGAYIEWSRELGNKPR